MVSLQPFLHFYVTMVVEGVRQVSLADCMRISFGMLCQFGVADRFSSAPKQRGPEPGLHQATKEVHSWPVLRKGPFRLLSIYM